MRHTHKDYRVPSLSPEHHIRGVVLKANNILAIVKIALNAWTWCFKTFTIYVWSKLAYITSLVSSLTSEHTPPVWSFHLCQSIHHRSGLLTHGDLYSYKSLTVHNKNVPELRQLSTGRESTSRPIHIRKWGDMITILFFKGLIDVNTAFLWNGGTMQLEGKTGNKSQERCEKIFPQ